MNYKMIAVDMDGTLLNDQGVISDATAETINRAVDAGVIFTISTGRPIQGIKKFNAQINLKGPSIAYNGAMIVLANTQEILYEQGLLEEDAKKIVALGLEYDTTMCIWSNNQLYGNRLDEKIHTYKKMSGVEPILITDYEALYQQGITKILWYDEQERIDKFQEELGNDFESVTYCTSKPIFLEFFNQKVSKAVAMEKIGELYNIKREEMIAVGDGLNDLSMIQYAGLGVAMDNASDEVKQHAQDITASNNEDGVKKVIEKYFL